MTVPQGRNEKKYHRKRKQLFKGPSLGLGNANIRLGNRPYYSKDGSPMSLEDKSSFEEWLEDTEPVDSIEAFVNDPNRILKLADEGDPDMADFIADFAEDY